MTAQGGAPPSPRWLLSRLYAFLTALVCLAFTSTLRDVPAWVAIAQPYSAPPMPADETDRDATLRVEVVDETGASVASAVVSVFSIRDDRAYVAGSFLTDRAGIASGTKLPRGVTWVLVEAAGRQRSSTQLVLQGEPRVVQVTLRLAGKLAVRVTDDEGRPIHLANIELRGGDPLPFIARTDIEGKADIGRLGPSPWSVKVWAPGFDTVSRTSVGAGASPLHITLRAMGQLHVKVKMPDGEPAIEARVVVAGSGLWPARQVTTDRTGEIRVVGLAAGAYDVAASLADLVSETQIGVPLKRGETQPVELILKQGRQIVVNVVSDDLGEPAPIAGARVVLAEDGITSFPREGVTGPEGTVVLGPITDRPASVAARAEGFVARSGVLVPAALDGPLVISLVRGAVLLGEAVDDRDFPVAGASVEVIGVDFAGMPVDETPELIGFRSAHFAWALPGPQPLIPAGELGVMPGPSPRIPPVGALLFGKPRAAAVAPPGASDEPVPDAWVTDKDGRFRCKPVPPGRLRAIVRHPGYVEGISELVTLTPGHDAKVRVVLHSGAALEGRVLEPGGRPVAGARVEISAANGSLVRSTHTATDGTFAFAAVPSEITVSVARPDGVDPVVKKALSLDDRGRREITLTLPEVRDPIEIRVRDDRGLPLPAVQITALSLSTDSPLRTTRFTSDAGTVAIPDALGLPLRLDVSLGGYAPVRQSLDKAERELTITLRRGVLVTGEIRTRGLREPLEGAEVTLYTATGVRHARTDAEGRFTFKDLPPGKGKLVLMHKGYARVERAVTVPETEEGKAVALERMGLEEAGSVEGEVLDREGNPVMGARVSLGPPPAYLPVGPVPAGMAVTNAKGRFTLGDLPEGEIVLQAYAAERGRGREKVRVHVGSLTRDVRIRLDEATLGKEEAAAAGVAITLTESGARTKRVFTIETVAPGSTAELAGLRADDVIASIDDHAPESLEDARKGLSGPLGDDVLIVVLRDGERHVFRVARERVRR